MQNKVSEGFPDSKIIWQNYITSSSYSNGLQRILDTIQNEFIIKNFNVSAFFSSVSVLKTLNRPNKNPLEAVVVWTEFCILFWCLKYAYVSAMNKTEKILKFRSSKYARAAKTNGFMDVGV